MASVDANGNRNTPANDAAGCNVAAINPVGDHNRTVYDGVRRGVDGAFLIAVRAGMLM